MDKTLHILEHLYGEDSELDLQELLQDDALQAEYEALGKVKAALDQRSTQRPEASTLNAIMAAAAAQSTSAPPATARADRSAKPRQERNRLRMIGALAATFALLITVGIVFTQAELTGLAPALSEQVMSMEMDEKKAFADRPAEIEAPVAMDSDASFADAVAKPASPAHGGRRAKREVANQTPQRQLAPASAPPTMVAEEEALGAALADDETASPAVAFAALAPEQRAAAAPDSLPVWDEADELREIHRGIELLQARSADDAWDDPAVMSLDVLPTQQEPSRLDQGLNTVGTKRTRDNQ